jgi:hypothetical protein
MNIDKDCSCCGHVNEKDNFLCSACGFYLDMSISLNDYGLPDIEQK